MKRHSTHNREITASVKDVFATEKNYDLETDPEDYNLCPSDAADNAPVDCRISAAKTN